MTPRETAEAIAIELRIALRTLGARQDDLDGVDWTDNGAVRDAVNSYGAGFELLCAVYSRGDPMSDDQVLRYLQAINQSGTIVRKAISEGE